MQKRVVESQADETRTETDKVAVETRLTAEQFFATFTGREYDGHYGELDVFAFAEAFRDKSEANLLTVIKGYELREHQVADDAFEQNAGLREEIERLKDWKESQMAVTPDWQKIGELLNIGLGQSVTENIIPAITELRAKLAAAERYGKIEFGIEQILRKDLEEANNLRRTAEAELAALRERERWISVKEKLPEIVREFGGRDNNMYGESGKILIFNGELHIGWLYKSGIWDSVDGNKITGVTHWRLSFGPEGQ